MKKSIFRLQLSFVFLFCAATSLYSQSDNVGIGTTTPNASSILELQTTNKGFLPPRMTTAQRDAISSPATGLIIYNTTTSQINAYNGSTWVAFLSSGNSLNQAYDQGGAGSGRTITVDNGGVTLTGALAGEQTLIASNSANGGVALFTNTGNGIAALINNEGTGASFRVNDANSDTSPFLIDDAGNVGIGIDLPTRKLEVNGTLRVGTNGNTITNVIKETISQNVANVAAGTSVTEVFTLASTLATASTVYISPENSLNDGLLIAYARVTGANTIEVKFYNASGSSIDLAAMNFYITVIE